MVKYEYPDQEESKPEEDASIEMESTDESNRNNADDEQMLRCYEMYCNMINNQFSEMNVQNVDFRTLESQMDHLNSFLDDLEQKNDNIHAELIELLRSNREVRLQFQRSSQTEEQTDQ